MGNAASNVYLKVIIMSQNALIAIAIIQLHYEVKDMFGKSRLFYDKKNCFYKYFKMI